MGDNSINLQKIILISLFVGIVIVIGIFILIEIGESSDEEAAGSNSDEILYLNAAQSLSIPGESATITSSSATTANNSWLSFDGVGDKVIFGNSSDFSPNKYGNQATFTLWMNISNMTGGEGSDGRHYVFSKGTGSGNYEYDLVATNSSNKDIYLRTISSNGASVASVGCTNDYVIGDWTFCGFTINDSMEAYNGGYHSASAAYSAINITGIIDLHLGGRGSTDSIRFKGSIDDFRIYNQTLGTASLRKVYQEGNYGDTTNFIPVLMHHQYLPTDSLSSLRVNETQFRNELQILSDLGYESITDFEYWNWTQDLGFEMPENPIMFVWDDNAIEQWIAAAEIQAEYGYKSIGAIYTQGIDDATARNWTGVNILIDDYNWSIASHSDTHCSFGGNSAGSGGIFCNETDVMQGNMSLSKAKIAGNTSITPITLIHPYNDWNTASMNSCSLNYTLCFGRAAGESSYKWSNYISKNTNFTNGELQRIEISNETTNYTLQYRLNKSFGLNGLIINSKLNEQTGTTAYDASGNSNDGTITGATWDNDGSLVSLTSGVDYSASSAGVFTILNNDYDYSLLEVNWSWDYLTTTVTKTTARNISTGLGGGIDWVGIFIIVGFAAALLGYLSLKKTDRSYQDFSY